MHAYTPDFFTESCRKTRNTQVVHGISHFKESYVGKEADDWWLFRITLVVAFGPKILGDGGDLQIVVLLENAYSFSGGDNVR